MAALVNERPDGSIRVVKRDRRPLSAAVKAIKGGAAVCDAATGFFKPAVAATTLRMVGRFTETIDNLAGAAGAKLAEIDYLRERILMLYKNDGVNPVVVADRESNCFLVDDQTVSQLATGRSVAGIVYDVTSEGVWVEFTHNPAAA